jgi:hypothetical protein
VGLPLSLNFAYILPPLLINCAIIKVIHAHENENPKQLCKAIAKMEILLIAIITITTKTSEHHFA